MKTIIVDGSKAAGEQIREECLLVPGIDVVKVFTDPEAALEYVYSNRVEFALMEVKLEPVDGIELTRRMRAVNPDMIVIFVSDQSGYMLEALRVKADYFVLKPYEREDILDALNRAKLLSKRLHKRVYIRTFGRFDVFIDGRLVNFANSKSKELLALCVDRMGGEVSMEEAVDKLWPDRDYDNRVKALYRKAVIGIHSLLEAQGVPEVFCNRRGVCYLMEDQVECDFYDFLRHQNNREELYSGEYMFEYSWAEETNAWLQKLEDDLKTQKFFNFP